MRLAMMVAAGSRARDRAVGCAFATRPRARLAGFPTIISPTRRHARQHRNIPQK
jgi:hypothetical protein